MVDFLLEYGYIGLFVGAFLAATVIPFSSDVMLVGLLAIGAEPVPCVVVATLGNWLGGMSSYALGYLGKWDWLERYFKMKRETLEKQQSKVTKYGAGLAFMSWLPGVGDVFAIALGFYKLNAKKVAIYMFIGKGFRFVMWAVFYYWVEPMVAG